MLNAAADLHANCQLPPPAPLPAVLSHVLGSPVPTEKVRLGGILCSMACLHGPAATALCGGLPRNGSRRVALVPSLIQACFTKPPTLPPSSSQAIDLEMRCLKNLRWRLGPYCCAAPART